MCSWCCFMLAALRVLYGDHHFAITFAQLPLRSPLCDRFRAVWFVLMRCRDFDDRGKMTNIHGLPLCSARVTVHLKQHRILACEQNLLKIRQQTAKTTISGALYTIHRKLTSRLFRSNRTKASSPIAGYSLRAASGRAPQGELLRAARPRIEERRRVWWFATVGCCIS